MCLLYVRCVVFVLWREQNTSVIRVWISYIFATSCSGDRDFLQSEESKDEANRGAHLPQRPELPLLNTQELANFPCHYGGMSGGVVQDRLSERRAGPQGAYGNGIL